MPQLEASHIQHFSFRLISIVLVVVISITPLVSAAALLLNASSTSTALFTGPSDESSPDAAAATSSANATVLDASYGDYLRLMKDATIAFELDMPHLQPTGDWFAAASSDDRTSITFILVVFQARDKSSLFKQDYAASAHPVGRNWRWDFARADTGQQYGKQERFFPGAVPMTAEEGLSLIRPALSPRVTGLPQDTRLMTAWHFRERPWFERFRATEPVWIFSFGAEQEWVVGTRTRAIAKLGRTDGSLLSNFTYTEEATAQPVGPFQTGTAALINTS